MPVQALEEAYQFPPDLLSLLIDVIPRLCRSKQDVLQFFRAAGVHDSVLSDLARRVSHDSHSINKFEIVRTVLSRLNGDSSDRALATRRQILHNVAGFESFSSCWPKDALEARGLVAQIRQLINEKDAFSRMKQIRESERLARESDRLTRIDSRRASLESAKKALYGLFQAGSPKLRGKQFEGVLHSLFSVYGILVREAFTRVGTEGEGVVEQIDGAVELCGRLFLVEAKWTKERLGTAEVSPHLVRIYARHDVGGLMISAAGFSDAAISTCRDALGQRVIVLMSLQELVRVAEEEGGGFPFSWHSRRPTQQHWIVLRGECRADEVGPAA